MNNYHYQVFITGVVVIDHQPDLLCPSGLSSGLDGFQEVVSRKEKRLRKEQQEREALKEQVCMKDQIVLL